MREFEEKASVRAKPVLARSVVDDVKDWWNGSSQVAQRAPKPEKPFTKQDHDQTLALVNTPLAGALQDISAKSDVSRWRLAHGKLGPAANALKVIASHKKEAANQAAILAGVPHIEKAQATLQVLGDWQNAPNVWLEAFRQALAAADQALAAPVIDPDAAKDADNADPPPADGVFKRDHELIEASVKPALENLIAETAGEPFKAWNPLEYSGVDQALTALGAVSAKQLAPAKAALEKGKAAIKAFTSDIDTGLESAKADIETALTEVARAAGPYYTADRDDPRVNESDHPVIAP